MVFILPLLPAPTELDSAFYRQFFNIQEGLKLRNEFSQKYV